MSENENKPLPENSNPKEPTQSVPEIPKPLTESLNDIPGHIRGEIANNKWDFQDTITPIRKGHNSDSRGDSGGSNNEE